jgi:diguanylate cyclase (GGDEF)-like protein
MKFKSLKSQIIFIFLTLIILIQFAGLIPLGVSINKNAHASVQRDLQVGEKVFLNILDNNTESLQQGAKILASDYGFRDSIATNDDETIISALNNHQSRINADIAIFYSAKGEKTIISGNVSVSEASSAVKRMISKYDSTNKSLDLEVFNGYPYQIVLVPVKAPLTIGWVLMGFKIDDALAIKLNSLSNLDVTFLLKRPDTGWSPVGSTFKGINLNELMNSFRKISVTPMKNYDMDVGNNIYGSRVLNLTNSGALVVVLQRSISEATEQFETLRYTLFTLTVIGILIFIFVTIHFSKVITRPITKLSEIAKELEQGNYKLDIKTDREDEIGDLSKAFNSMTEAIGIREQKVARLAYWDEVTNLPNRTSFMSKLSEVIKENDEKNEVFTILVINLDRFKQINNIMGRIFGDALLKKVGEILIRSIRKSTDFAARLGADEYAVILRGQSRVHGLKIANNIIKLFETPIKVFEQNIDISAGIGLAFYPEHGSTDEQLLHNAETALATAKKRKISIVEYDQILDVNLQENLMMASELKFAIENSQLSLYLQPKINISTKQAYSTEALVRWIHPEKGFIFPDQFIPFAEQSGLIQKISLWMIMESCKVIAMFREQGLNLTIAVNISTKDLIDSDFPYKILDLLNQYKISSQSLSLEITESSIMDDPARAETTLNSLADMGLKIAIDDFGTGYSSLSYLKRLPVHKLKIDKSFVMNMENDESDRKIVKSTIDLGHNLNLEVIAEGIENKHSWKLLEEMGCDYGQGYFMGKPMPVNNYLEWLKAWNEKVISWDKIAA